jgi:hypothetical protein
MNNACLSPQRTGYFEYIVLEEVLQLKYRRATDIEREYQVAESVSAMQPLIVAGSNTATAFGQSGCGPFACDGGQNAPLLLLTSRSSHLQEALPPA